MWRSGSTDHGGRPDAGNQLRWATKTMRRSTAVTKTGIDTKDMHSAERKRSRRDPCRKAMIMPTSTPTPRLMMSVTAAISRERPRRMPMSTDTGRWLIGSVPRSKRTMWLSQFQYWCSSDWSSP